MDFNWGYFFLNPAVVWITIPLAVILVGGVKTLASMYFSHQERIAMIEQGMYPPEGSERSDDEIV